MLVLTLKSWDMIKRQKYIDMIKMIVEVKKSVFLVWSRQVGKTSLMKSLEEFDIFPGKKYCYINFDQVVLRWIVEFGNLKEFVSYINGYFWVDIDKYDIILFDEVVRIKNFNIILKALIDNYWQGKTFVCSASGNYDFVHNIIEWLAGRVVKLEVFPLDFREYLLFRQKPVQYENITKSIFELIKDDILEYLSFWSYPEVVLTNWYENKYIVMKSIVDSVMDRDLRMFIKEDKFIDLNKFMSYMAMNIGSLFSYEWVSNTLGIKLNDIKKFISVLEKSFLLFRLYPYFTDKKQEYSFKSKVYFNDFGIANYSLDRFTKKVHIDGKDIEMFVFLNLLYSKKPTNQLFFYQKLNGSEIDFIFSKDWKLIPIEAKSTNNINIPKIFSSFCSKYEDKIDYFVKTTTSTQLEREFNDKVVKLIPFWDVL